MEVERRKSLRFNAAVPLSIVENSTEIHVEGVTRDISSSGVCWFTMRYLPVGAAITITLEVPSEVILAAPLRAKCKGHVVRVQSQPEGRGFLIAARLERFQFLGAS